MDSLNAAFNLLEIVEEITEPEVELENQTINMAQTINFQLFKIDLDTIPYFEGNEHEINYFVRVCSNIHTRHQAVPEVQTVIIDSMFSKLKGRAKQILAARDDLLTWPQLKTAIIEHFSDNRDFE